jgi:predicted DNA-binding transcriptional regulator YafY
MLDRLRGRRRGVLIADLASEFEVTERQVRNDLVALEEAGYTPEYGRHENRSTVIMVEASSRAVPLTRRERYTLLAVRSMFDVLRDTPFYEDVASVCEKLMELLTPSEREELTTFGERFVYVPDGGVKTYEGKEDVLDALQTGILTRRLVSYLYRGATSGKHQRGVLAPYAILLYRHGLYVVAHRFHDAESAAHAPTERLGVYAVERFVEAEWLPRTKFELPQGLRLADLFQGAFGVHLGGAKPAQRVVIEFGKDRRGHVAARQWHPTQKTAAMADGGMRLEFEVSDLTEVASWVMSWGPHARVVEPASLVEKVAAELRAAAGHYDTAPDPLAKAA